MPSADAVRELVKSPETYKPFPIIAAGVPEFGVIPLAEKIPFENRIYEENISKISVTHSVTGQSFFSAKYGLIQYITNLIPSLHQIS